MSTYVDILSWIHLHHAYNKVDTKYVTFYYMLINYADHFGRVWFRSAWLRLLRLHVHCSAPVDYYFAQLCVPVPILVVAPAPAVTTEEPDLVTGSPKAKQTILKYNETYFNLTHEFPEFIYFRI